jgi:hypothetical protein
VRDLVPPPEQFLVQRWSDPVVEAVGFPVNSIYTETVLLPILSPSATLCLRRLAAWATISPDGSTVDTTQLARDLGLGDGLGRNSAISRTLNRLCWFDLAQWSDHQLAVRTTVAPLPPHQLRRLSPPILAVHQTLLRQAGVYGRAYQSPAVAATVQAAGVTGPGVDL